MTSRRWRWRTRSTPSSAAVRGDLDEARRRRLERARLLRRVARRPVRDRGARRTRRRSSPILDGDLDGSRAHYRAATEGFARIDRPVMNSMCLGMVADFDERAGDYAAADHDAGGGDRDQRRRLLGGFTGSLLARLGWVLLHDGRAGSGRDGLPARARRGPPRAQHAGDVPRPRPGWPSCTGSTVATTPRSRLATEAARALPGRRAPPVPEPHRPPARPAGAGAAVCCAVLGVLAAEAGRRGASGDACSGTPSDSAARPARRRAGVPARRRRPGSRRGEAALGRDAFLAAFELGRRGELDEVATA